MATIIGMNIIDRITIFKHIILAMLNNYIIYIGASEVIFDSEVHFVSEVSPDGEVMGKLNFTCA